jgi:hypothetical protein
VRVLALGDAFEPEQATNQATVRPTALKPLGKRVTAAERKRRQFRAEAVPLLILEPLAAAIAIMAATNKCLAQSNKSRVGSKATKNRPLNNLTCRACHRERLHSPDMRTKWNWNTR